MTSLRYRLRRESDEPEIRRLLDEAGWAKPAAEWWLEWYRGESPCGPRMVIVGVDDADRACTQLQLHPTRVLVEDAEIRALRLSAPVVGKNVRPPTKLAERDHPFVRLLEHARDVALEHDYPLLFSYPRRGWLPLLDWTDRFGICRFEGSEHDCVAMRLSKSLELRPEDADRLTVSLARSFDSEYDDLWQSARSTFPITCGVVRDAAWLRWKSIKNCLLEVRERSDGSLIGYAAARRSDGLLSDILSRTPEELVSVLVMALRWWAGDDDLERQKEGFQAAMLTPQLKDALQDLGFEPQPYKFAFVCSTLDESLPAPTIAPDRWYLTPDD